MLQHQADYLSLLQAGVCNKYKWAVCSHLQVSSQQPDDNLGIEHLH